MDYALIENGVVTNIIWLHPNNAHDFPESVPMGDVPAAIGDTYKDGVFYRNGERVLTITEQMQIAVAETDAAAAAYAEGVQEA